MFKAEAIGRLYGLEGKVALVTGAAHGIGCEIATLFATAGAKVALADIDIESAQRVAERINADAGSKQALAVRMDQAGPASIDGAFKEVDRFASPLDVLVNCAAIYPFKRFEEADAQFIDRILATNIRGVFLCTQQAVKRMKLGDRGGSIVNISSVNSKKACIYDNVHYGISKAGVNNLTICIALEYAAHNIRVNAVLPGSIATEHARKAGEGFELRGPFMQAGRIPLTGGPASPSEIANACLFLASDASRYVTGQLLAVDGGFLVS